MIKNMWNLFRFWRIIIAKVANLLGPGTYVPAVKSNNFAAGTHKLKFLGPRTAFRLTLTPGRICRQHKLLFIFRFAKWCHFVSQGCNFVTLVRLTKKGILTANWGHFAQFVKVIIQSQSFTKKRSEHNSDVSNN